MEEHKNTTAYFTMECALEDRMRNYAGGLGILAADILLSCADTETPVVGVSLIYHQDDDPRQALDISQFAEDTGKKIIVQIEERDVDVAIWRTTVRGVSGKSVDLILLSTYVESNEQWDRDITKHLYSSEEYTRICQEAILGIGGVRALEALDIRPTKYHMNEGHCSFLTLELLRVYECEDTVRSMCTFTTHTPVEAGFDRFSPRLVGQVLTTMLPEDTSAYIHHDRFDMARLGMKMSKHNNSVAKRHNTLCHDMFPEFSFENITNGMYHPRWAGKAMTQLFDRYLPEWQAHPEIFKEAPERITTSDLRICHGYEKEHLIQWVNAHPEFFPFDDITEDDLLEREILTLGFARRFVPYKRPELILHEIERFAGISKGKVQLIFAGKCHPADGFCNSTKALIRERAFQLRNQVRICVLPTHNIEVASYLTTGCDAWLNTPVPPQEASGTSGMKAAMNGLLNLSVADGWWMEGFRENPSAGWSFWGGSGANDAYVNSEDAHELLNKLEDVVACYYERPEEWLERMKAAISLTATFNTHRCIKEYQDKLWS